MTLRGKKFTKFRGNTIMNYERTREKGLLHAKIDFGIKGLEVTPH